MTVTVHGVPGARTAEVAGKYGRDARRGAFYEGVTGCALEKWLAGRRGACHLFHDLTGLEAVSGHGYGPMGLGAGNIDHVILDAEMAVTIDAKGIGGGKLTVDDQGHGVLIRPDGSCVPQPWMDTRRNYSYVAVMYRLTGLPGHLVWVVPAAVDLDEHALGRARCFADGGSILTLASLEPGLGDVLCGRRAPADLVERLAAYTAQGHVRRLTAYPWSPTEPVELPAG
jgi:hypothetical protein